LKGSNHLTDLRAVKRHYGLDWLRIGAFAILILYHSALHFGPHPWVVRAHQTYEWLALPLAAIYPWRLLVLFAVSGYATAAMMGRSKGIFPFFRERSSRLLIPLLFGITFIVPPQSWARFSVDYGYTGSLFQFWLQENFRFSSWFGHTLPHWEHLWFLGYLWAYTGLVVLFMACVRPWQRGATALAGLLAKGPAVLLAPISFLVITRLTLMKLGLTGTGMFDDWLGDSHYLPAFLFGFLLAIHPPLWDAIRRWWTAAAALAALSYGTIVALLGLYGTVENLPTIALALEAASDSMMGWSMMIVMFKLADTVLNRDHPLRETLARAIFPAYLVHQTAIVLMGWYLLDFKLPGVVAFIIIAATVVTSSAAAYWLATRVGWLGTLLGVPPRPSAPKTRLATA
jgi:glucans biosynthesis protein C